MAKFTLKDSVPPILPFDWQDWDQSRHILKMSETEEGVYIRLLRKQWVAGWVPADPWELAKYLNCRYENVRKWLKRFGHMFRCMDCDGIAWHPEWHDKGEAECVAPEVSSLCSACVVPVYCPCSCRVAGVYCSCSPCVAGVYHEKLLNYRKYVACGNPLGTIQSNLTKTNKTKTTVRSSSPVLDKESKSTTSKPESEIELISESAKANAPSELRDWNEDEFGISAERIRNCVKYQLDSKKNQWYEQNLSSSTLQKKEFLLKLDKDTPANWTPPTPKPVLRTGGGYEMQPDPNCTLCQRGKIYTDGIGSLCSCNTQVWVSDEVI